MASRPWTQEDLDKALLMMKEERMSFREAALAYGIPKSTLHDHYSGKVKGTKRGPATVLSEAEESMLVEWALEMAKIGYGRTREQISEMVKRLLDKDGRSNPFVENRPGRDWWYGFLQRHPELSFRSPEQLQISRASACSKERLTRWYRAFEQFLKANGVKDPDQVWNADETGCPLCPKSGRVLALCGAKDVYQVTGNSKEQVTTLCAISAAGNFVPPMHIFAGKRFKVDPMDGCVSNAYFGKSQKGWITTELFYQWLTEHFIKYAAAVRPLVLLVDGHSSHIDVNTSKFCKENRILLYCLPSHSSHITQPLDVGFYGPLKTAWKKAVSKYTLDNIGKSVTKYTFARVFKEAWLNTVKLSTIVNSFRCAGIWPVNPDVRESKVSPAALYHDGDNATDDGAKNEKSAKTPSTNPSTTTADKPSKLAMEVMEAALTSPTRKKFEERYDEGYDVEDDELYMVWARLKALTISECEEQEVGDEGETAQELSREDFGQRSEIFRQNLVVPKSVPRKKTRGGTSHMPPHISGDEAIAQMVDKVEKKRIAEEEKKQRKEEREAKRRQKEKEKAEKSQNRTSQKRKGRKQKSVKASVAASDPEDDDDTITCPVCCDRGCSDALWVCCDVCDTWYHAECTDISPEDYEDLGSIEWFCSVCIKA